MDSTQLKFLRTLLFFTQDEAATYIGFCTARSWNYYETGARQVPPSVAEKLEFLLNWRSAEIARVIKDSEAFYRVVLSDLEPGSVPIFYFADAFSYGAASAMSPEFWRSQQSVNAELLASGCFRLVPFDLDAYMRFSAGKLMDENTLELYRLSFAVEPSFG